MWTWKEQNVVGSNFYFYLMVEIKKPLQKLLDWLSYDKHREFSSINKATNEYEPAINAAVCRFFLLNNCVNSSKRLFGVTIKRRGTFFFFNDFNFNFVCLSVHWTLYHINICKLHTFRQSIKQQIHVRYEHSYRPLMECHSYVRTRKKHGKTEVRPI